MKLDSVMFAPELKATELKLMSAPVVLTEPVATHVAPEVNRPNDAAVPDAAAATVEALKVTVDVASLLGNDPETEPAPIEAIVKVAKIVPAVQESGSCDAAVVEIFSVPLEEISATIAASETKTAPPAPVEKYAVTCLRLPRRGQSC